MGLVGVQIRSAWGGWFPKDAKSRTFGDWGMLLIMDTPLANKLYFAVLPQIVVSGTSFGRTEQILTLVPDKNFASAFFLEEVDTYIQVFHNRQSYLVGGHVTGYDIDKEPASDGRFYVRATQHVA